VSAIITISFCVPPGYTPGDYARVFSNGGSGDINYETPAVPDKFDLFTNGSGIYGFGYAPWGYFRWGCACSCRTPGFGYQPWGYFSWGYGAAEVKAVIEVAACGRYEFAFITYDAAGNADSPAGGRQQLEVNIHIAPAVPAGLVKKSYDKDTDILILEAA